MQVAFQFCELALGAASHLPASERADLYSFAATILTEGGNHDAAKAADAAATALREAEAAQLTFKRLLTTPLTDPKSAIRNLKSEIPPCPPPIRSTSSTLARSATA